MNSMIQEKMMDLWEEIFKQDEDDITNDEVAIASCLLCHPDIKCEIPQGEDCDEVIDMDDGKPTIFHEGDYMIFVPEGKKATLVFEDIKNEEN